MSSSLVCTCNENLKECKCRKVQNNQSSSNNNTIFGINKNYYYSILMIQIIFWLLLLFCCISVFQVCKENNSLKPIIFVLLILWILLCWIPHLGILLFFIILIVLICYFNKCKKSSNLEYVKIFQY